MADNRRGHFRLEYPAPERPTVVFSTGEAFYVLDLSESGMRFDCTSGLGIKPGTPVVGQIKFADGATCAFKGRILRYSNDRTTCVMMLTHGVPLARMMEEHRRVIRKYQM